MNRLISVVLLCMISGCMSAGQGYKYKCVAGDEVYYANDFTAIVIADEKVLIGDCRKI